MKILISPAKKMKEEPDLLPWSGLPEFLEQSEELLAWLRTLTYEQLKALWKCNDRIAETNVQRLERMDLRERLTPAILSYEGIAYQYMAPAVFEDGQIHYVQEHLRILSGFYGVLRPLDGVVPYRLEMQAKASPGGKRNLYDFWGERIYQAVREEDGAIINLASREYSRCVEPYLKEEDRYITVTFCEESKGKLVTKGTYAKMARGEMVRYMAEHHVREPEELRGFDRLWYEFREDLSSRTEYIFQRRITGENR